jgi:hypothetical protein
MEATMTVGEWDERQLCPDGTCVGVIGPDGTCKVCGRVAPNWGDERNRGLIDPPDDDDDDDDDDDELAADGDGDDDGGDEAGDEDYVGDDEDEGEGDEAGQTAGAGNGSSPPPPALAAPGEWTSRQLCPDGACIGVIGPDGQCKVCRRRASDDPGTQARTSAPEDAALPGGAAAEPAAEPAAVPAAVPTPCSDAACTGVVGAEGTCSVCGKVVA